MLYLGILCNFMSIFLIFALSKINYARTLIYIFLHNGDAPETKVKIRLLPVLWSLITGYWSLDRI
jgi:hypothetical protein